MRPSSAHSAILPKPKFTLDLTEKALKILMYPQENILGGNFFSAKMQVLESVPAILLKTNSTRGIIWHEFWKTPLFNISENFLRGITVIPFIQEVVTLLKMTCLELYSYIELTFRSKENFNCVTDNAYIWMPMSIPIPMQRYRCQDFKMAFCRFIGDHLLCFVELLNDF